MSRYIDANNFNKILCELIEDHRKDEFETDYYYYLKALVDLREILKKMPTANVEEVRPEQDCKNKNIYVVTVGDYSDYRILAVFENADKAAAYIDSRTWKNGYSIDYDVPKIEEYEAYDDRIEAVNSKAVYLYWYGIVPTPEFDKESVCFELTSQKTANQYINSAQGIWNGFIYCALSEPNFEKACKILADKYYERKARRAGVCDDFRR